MPLTSPQDWMQAALAEAESGRAQGEVPVGAVVVAAGRIVARAHNEVEQRGDATAHAELLALQRAGRELGTWRLNDAALVVTLEPCPMCIGAVLLSRVGELYFGCYDSRWGACGSLFDLSGYPGISAGLAVYPELMKEQCSSMLQGFFPARR